MHQSIYAALAALTATALAVPTELLERAAPAGFSIPQVSTGKKIFKNGPAEVVKTHLKYGAIPPSWAVSAAAAVQSGEVTASPSSYDSEYLCPVSVGTPAQSLVMDFDTGSSDFWVFSNLMPSSQSTGHKIYTPSSSSTGKKITGETWKISYGDNSGSQGVVYSDKVVIGGVSATSQSVEAATSASSQFQTDKASSGLVGLAFDNINTCTPTVCKTFLNNIQSSLPSALFTSKLKKGAAGTYDFGYIDTTKYTGSITYVSISTSNGFWQFTTTGYQVGSGSKVSSSISTIADTGTTLLYLPDNIVSAYYSKVSGYDYDYSAGGYSFPCGDTLPSLSLIIGGTTHTIPGSYLNYAPNGDGTCFGGLQSSDGIGFNILGDIFLKSQFVVWNFGSNKIGFAAQS